jgi:hypothetical protein
VNGRNKAGHDDGGGSHISAYGRRPPRRFGAVSSPFVGVGVFVMKLDMGFRGFARMMLGMFMMRMSEMCMMGARFVIAILDQRGGFAMMLGGVFMVLGGVLVMICSVLGVRHGRLLFDGRILRMALNSAILRQACDGRRQKAPPTSLP